jgi:release factor glutamine methyltransferase
MTVSEALRFATRRLRAASVPDAGHDADLLLRHVMGWDRARILTEGSSPLAAADESRYLELVAERERRRPLQHLTGVQAFWRHDFVVTPDVLIPRPETEILVEACIEELRGRVAPRIVDVGTGSGCIAITLALARPDAEVVAVDLSEAALDVARRNAARLGADRIAFQRGDLLTGEGRRFDLIASNPPYVDASEIEALAPEVRDHEPRSALVPPSGQREDIYRRLLPAAACVLAESGAVVVEIGYGMQGMIRAACADAGLEVTRVVPDLAGIPRVVVARRSGYRASTLPE